ncbi:hypothetical protein [Bartonella henselae]|uniref:Hypothetical genomic island protein n=1 Tax=Bartonella henselae (strain ATCC 49882 / DSM 28221 / CCUG 30454 / Houston 1) TaxID=283166 RepID=A0A0H3LY79_BARHE|nr:hypothetical protein [Bartonella henselae]ATP12264.1 hypothetical protein BhenCHDE101_03505 [Bartonella henselae]PNM38386.1 hypothetical protein AL470_002775 [Bartonella henselae str. Houston-1]UAK84881.1 hypothetical protein K8O99_03980 [Bartonella henselae]UJM35853.1 hypothetical protein KAE77_00195 [Bartonella henselae]UJM37342.1 hypothetical protein KAE71_00230 [Bartonella henselae]
MKQTLRLLGAVTLFGIAGCHLGGPPTSSIGMWEKPGADFTEIGKALLECGMPTPYDRDPENDNRSFNQMATVYACMVQSGFHYENEHEGGWCYTFRAENLPICRPGAVIPQRSVKKRLNSPFCKKYKNSRKCQP